MQKYENLEVFLLRKVKRLSIKIGKAELDIKFLRNCKMFNVVPKFSSFNLPYSNEVDSRFIHKQLVQRPLNKRQGELKKLGKDHAKILETLSMKLPSIDLHILKDVLGIMLEKQLITLFHHT